MQWLKDSCGDRGGAGSISESYRFYGVTGWSLAGGRWPLGRPRRKK